MLPGYTLNKLVVMAERIAGISARSFHCLYIICREKHISSKMVKILNMNMQSIFPSFGGFTRVSVKMGCWWLSLNRSFRWLHLRKGNSPHILKKEGRKEDKNYSFVFIFPTIISALCLLFSDSSLRKNYIYINRNV